MQREAAGTSEVRITHLGESVMVIALGDFQGELLSPSNRGGNQILVVYPTGEKRIATLVPPGELVCLTMPDEEERFVVLAPVPAKAKKRKSSDRVSLYTKAAQHAHALLQIGPVSLADLIADVSSILAGDKEAELRRSLDAKSAALDRLANLGDVWAGTRSIAAGQAQLDEYVREHGDRAKHWIDGWKRRGLIEIVDDQVKLR